MLTMPLQSNGTVFADTDGQLKMKLSGTIQDRGLPCFFAAFVACWVLMHAPDARSADILVVNREDAGAGSLREAIGNASPGDRIVFDIPGGGTITLLTDLPTITDSLTFANDNVAAVVIDRNGNSAISSTGGTIDLGDLNVIGGGPDVTLSPATTLIGDVDQVTANVTASGIIAPGANANAGTVGRLIIEGDLDATNATIQVDILGDVPNNDLIDVDGDVTITGATLVPTFTDSVYSAGTTFSVIEATGSLTTVFANATDVFQLTGNPFLEARIETLGSNVQLAVRDNDVSFASVLEGCNQLAAAAELDRLRPDPGPATAGQLAAIIRLRNGAATRVTDAANQLSGTIYTSLVDGQIQQVQNNIHGFRDRIVFHSDSVNEMGQWTPWARGYGSTMRVDSDECLTLGYRHRAIARGFTC